jgi:glucose dehydrogenase
VTPIVVAGTMFLTTPFNRVLAIDPETGQQKWSFDPKVDPHVHYSEGLVNRGVAFWSGPAGNGNCDQRIFLATIDARLFALDASTGQPCAGFGIGGQIDLKQGIANIRRPGEYEETSVPAVIGDLVIVGSSIADNDRVDSPDGAVRAFDTQHGALRWNWLSAPWCCCSPDAPVPIFTASSGRATTNGRTLSWRCRRHRASWRGDFNSSITISGITTPQRSPCSACCAETAAKPPS